MNIVAPPLPRCRILPPAPGWQPPAPGDPGIETWRDTTGAVRAYLRRDSPQHWIHLPGVASFGFTPDAGDVAAIAQHPARPGAIRDAFRRVVLPLVLQARGYELLHASAIRLPQGVFVFCAEKETGKSTIVFALERRGYPGWADDSVAWIAGESGPHAVPLPFAVRLRPLPAAFFAPLPPPRRVRRPARTLVPVIGIGVLQRQAPDAPIQVGRLAPAAAFPALLAHAQSYDLHDSVHKRRIVQHYLQLAAQVPVWDIRYPSGLERLPAILDAILQAGAESEPPT